MRPVEEAELAGLVGRAWELRHDPAYPQAVMAIVGWHEQRWIRWLDLLEASRAERRLAFLAELDELEREIDARITARMEAA